MAIEIRALKHMGYKYITKSDGGFITVWRVKPIKKVDEDGDIDYCLPDDVEADDGTFGGQKFMNLGIQDDKEVNEIIWDDGMYEII